jgi:L-ascorbate metabolism protein UlaG (beta-lactamase superfamily)
MIGMRLPSPIPGSGPAQGLTVRWLGHSTFVMKSPKGVRLLFDPFLIMNPSCPENAKRLDNLGELDLILVTHGHADHTADAAAVAKQTGAAVVASPEISSWLERKGVKDCRPMNIGGRQTISGLEIVMVQAIHSSSIVEDGTNIYLGPAAAFMVRFEDGRVVYFAGDTALFGDMRLLGERHAPALAFLPIGDVYTMGPEEAAIAAEWVGVKTVVPMHYGTFPVLTGTPDEFRRFCDPRGIKVVEMQPGEQISL